MAQGNLGNLLQHFVALNCAERLLDHWQAREKPVVYADCFSMQPWEAVERGNREGFEAVLSQFERKAGENDLVARTFLTAWTALYHPDRVPDDPLDRAYPNTAVLLRTAFPRQTWEMRLHDIVSEKRLALRDWASRQSPGTYAVEGCWRSSPLLCQNPVPTDAAAFLMLDPYKIVQTNRGKDYHDGYMDGEQIRALIGGFRLQLDERPPDAHAAPVLMTLFSFSDPDPEGKDELVRGYFKYLGWSVESVQCAPKRTWKMQTRHLGWVVSCGLPAPVLGRPLQDAWDDWLR